MRNPLARLIHRNQDKPTLRERAAALKASAARVIRIRGDAPPEAESEQYRPEPRPFPAGFVDDAGMVSYEDAAGTVHRRPVAEWIGFTAQRLNHVARSEFTRQFNAAAGEDADANVELEGRIRENLRLDAPHLLAFRSSHAFAAAKDAVIGHIVYLPGGIASGRPVEIDGLGPDAELLALGIRWVRANAVHAAACDRAFNLENSLSFFSAGPARGFRSARRRGFRSCALREYLWA